MTTMPCARCGERPVADPDGDRIGLGGALAIMCESCAAEGPLTPEESQRYRDRLEEERDSWPVHQPECFDAPIPGRQWYGGCEPADYDEERGYHGPGPRVDPATGLCEGCGGYACRVCGRENCPDHGAPAELLEPDPMPLLEETTDPSQLPTVSEWLGSGGQMREV